MPRAPLTGNDLSPAPAYVIVTSMPDTQSLYGKFIPSRHKAFIERLYPPPTFHPHFYAGGAMV